MILECGCQPKLITLYNSSVCKGWYMLMSLDLWARTLVGRSIVVTFFAFHNLILRSSFHSTDGEIACKTCLHHGGVQLERKQEKKKLFVYKKLPLISIWGGQPARGLGADVDLENGKFRNYN
jgi:hypothetical protein